MNIKNINRIVLFCTICLSILVSCSKENNPSKKGNHKPAILESINGIEDYYELGLHEHLKISPEYNFSSYNRDSVKYQWIINEEEVGVDSLLNHKCSDLGRFDGVLKVVSSKGTQIKEFTVNITSPYYKGLLLLSETKDGSMLSFKRLDKMDTPCSINTFKDNNEGLELGSKPLHMAWEGRNMTNYNDFARKTHQDVIISTKDPVKVYELNTQDMVVKKEIFCTGFTPNYILCPYGVQNFRWKGADYFLGDGKEFPYSEEGEFLNSKIDFNNGVELSSLACTVNTSPDMVIAYFNNFSKNMLYVSGLNQKAIEGDYKMDISPMNIIACDGAYREEASADYRYEPHHVMVIGYGHDEKTIHLNTFVAAGFKSSESLINHYEINSDCFTKESATVVNPVRPILYFSNKNVIYTCNYDADIFKYEEYIVLPEGFVVKDMTFDYYNPNEIYIAADDTTINNADVANIDVANINVANADVANINVDNAANLAGSLFIYNVENNTTSKKIFEDHHIAGNIKTLIYKGTGYENIKS